MHAFQGAGLAGWPAWMKAVVAASRQPGSVALASVQCPVPGTETSSALGMVAVAPATLAGGSVLSAVPLRNTTGTVLRTVPDTPGSCGQAEHRACIHWAWAVMKGANSDGPCWLTVAGFMAAHASLHLMVASCSAVGPAGVRPAVVSPSLAMTCDHWPRASACRMAGSWTALWASPRLPSTKDKQGQGGDGDPLVLAARCGQGDPGRVGVQPGHDGGQVGGGVVGPGAGGGGGAPAGDLVEGLLVVHGALLVEGDGQQRAAVQHGGADVAAVALQVGQADRDAVGRAVDVDRVVAERLADLVQVADRRGGGVVARVPAGRGQAAAGRGADRGRVDGSGCRLQAGAGLQPGSGGAALLDEDQVHGLVQRPERLRGPAHAVEHRVAEPGLIAVPSGQVEQGRRGVVGSGGGQHHDLQRHRRPVPGAPSPAGPTRSRTWRPARRRCRRSAWSWAGMTARPTGAGSSPRSPPPSAPRPLRARSTTPGGGADTVAEALPVRTACSPW